MPADLTVINVDVRNKFLETIARHGIKLEEYDHKCFTELTRLNDSLQMKCVDELSSSSLRGIRNPTGFFINLIRRVRDEANAAEDLHEIDGTNASGSTRVFVDASDVYGPGAVMAVEEKCHRFIKKIFGAKMEKFTAQS